MIVLHKEKGWEIVSHYTHGLLAAKIASKLAQDFQNDYWTDILVATAQHDDRLPDFEEKNYLTENGAPMDFTMYENDTDRIYPRMQRIYVEATQKSSLIGAIIGKHLEFLFTSLKDEDSRIADLLKIIEKDRKKQIKIYGLDKDKLDTMYGILRFADRLSLLLCQNKIPQNGRKVEINAALNEVEHYVYQNEEHYIAVPWCFEKKEFSILYEFRVLPKATFKDNSILGKAISDAKTQIRTVTFKKSSS